MWQYTNNELYRVLYFRDFKEAFAFLTGVAAISDRLQHHPRWQQDGNKVDIWLTTHDAGNQITDLDHKLAQQIDLLAATYTMNA